jgi:anti-sigma regulatory factor (Ser/Thr protein kinase)
VEGEAKSVCWRFEPHHTSVREVRTRVGEWLGGLLPERRSDVLVLVSELATNAVTHAGTEFEVTLVASPAGLRVEVTDAGAGEARIRPLELGESFGRGLRLVDSLAGSWGVKPRPAGESGKTGWFSIPVG